MTLQQTGIQRRQFGRRETSLPAIATIPGQTSKRCRLQNVSEGGALIVFEDEFVPVRPFRLTIDGTELNIICEVRHSGKYGVGAKFLNPNDGILLLRHLYPEPLQHDKPTWQPDAASKSATPAVQLNREIREFFLGVLEAERLAACPSARPRSKPRLDDKMRVAMLGLALKAVPACRLAIRSEMMIKKSLMPYYSAA